jgi:hypothetical protein
MMFSIALLEAFLKRLSTSRGVLVFQSCKYADWVTYRIAQRVDDTRWETSLTKFASARFEKRKSEWHTKV